MIKSAQNSAVKKPTSALKKQQKQTKVKKAGTTTKKLESNFVIKIPG